MSSVIGYVQVIAVGSIEQMLPVCSHNLEPTPLYQAFEWTQILASQLNRFDRALMMKYPIKPMNTGGKELR